MEHVGGQDEVELLGMKTLSRGVLFDVQELIADEGVRGELFLGLSEEQGRDIGKDIFGLIRWQVREDEGSRAASSGPDLEDSEGPVAGQARQRRRGRLTAGASWYSGRRESPGKGRRRW